ncbi:hypothetical protein ACJIZ3_021687 [Penstemon smallii]|uniref:UspA domain-containing protein n=1 Tax=Penstemon smallii TaxID=265156 RepID=A0ABD3SN38_9LAMI
MESSSVEAVVLRPDEAAETGDRKMRVLVAVDDSDESFYALQWVLETLIELQGLATGEKENENDYFHSTSLMLTIIHVMEPFPYYVFPGIQPVFPTTSIIQSANKSQQETASAILNRAVNMCTERKVKAKTSILKGDPKEIICDAAEQMHIDLIVVGSRGLGKIKRAFLGSVSDHVLHRAKCPVLIIKPPNEMLKKLL